MKHPSIATIAAAACLAAVAILPALAVAAPDLTKGEAKVQGNEWNMGPTGT